MVDTAKVDFVRDESGAIKLNEQKQPLVDFGGGRIEPYDLGRNIAKVGELAAERDTFRTQAEQHAQTVERYKGVDLDKYRKDQEILAKFTDGQVIEAKLVEQQIKDALTGKDTEIGQLKETLASIKADAFSKTVKFHFASPRVQALLSPAIQHPDDAMSVLGAWFYEDSQGAIRAKDPRNGNIVRSRRNPGEPADFDEAVEIILDQHPRGQSLRAAPTQQGAGSEKGEGGRTDSGFTITRADAKDMAKYQAVRERAAKAGQQVQVIG